FLEDELLSLVPRVLLGYVVIAGARAAHELDFLRDGLCHLILAYPNFARTLLAAAGKSRPGGEISIPCPRKRHSFRFFPLRHWGRSRASEAPIATPPARP